MSAARDALVKRLRELLEDSERHLSKLPWRVVPCDGKPTIAGNGRSGNIFRGYIATWQEADLAVAAVNALPEIIEALSRPVATGDDSAGVGFIAPDEQHDMACDIAKAVCIDLCELPDRSSPEDWPEACLVTSDELYDIVNDRIAEALADHRPLAPKPSIDHITGMTPEAGVRVRSISERLLKHMREVARQDGWALGLHGSMTRDLDLIAVPWTETATDETAFVEAMRAAVARELSGKAFIGAGNDRRTAGHEDKPHGRRCWTIHSLSEQLVETDAGAHPYVDLAIVDQRLSTPTTENSAEAVERFDPVVFGCRVIAAMAGRPCREVAAETGLSAATINRVSRGERPDVATYLTLSHWMALTSKREGASKL